MNVDVIPEANTSRFPGIVNRYGLRPPSELIEKLERDYPNILTRARASETLHYSVVAETMEHTTEFTLFKYTYVISEWVGEKVLDGVDFQKLAEYASIRSNVSIRVVCLG